MSDLFTLGYGGVPWSTFAAALTEAGVQTVVDVRIAPYSKSAPHYCRDELAARLGDLGIGYLHDPDLGNPVRTECMADGSLAPYRQHLAAHQSVLSPVLALASRQRVALLCGCHRSGQCHRGVIAEALLALLPGLKVEHLAPPQGEDRGPAPRILGLTLHQPWAFAVAHAGKRVENRSRRPWCSVGTYLAIHAGKTLDKDALRALRSEGIQVPATLPSMAIVAVARLQSVVLSDTQIDDDQCRWWCGPVGWVLDDVVALPQPVPVKGAQGLWRIPDDVLAAVRVQWKVGRHV